MNRALFLALIALPGLIGTSAEAAVSTISFTAKGKVLSSTGACVLRENLKIVPYCGSEGLLPVGTPWTFSVNMAGEYEEGGDPGTAYWKIVTMTGIDFSIIEVPIIEVSITNGRLNYINVYDSSDCCATSGFSVMQNRVSYYDNFFNLGLQYGWDDDSEYLDGGREEYGGGHLTSLYIDGVRTGYVPEPSSWAMMLAGFGLVGGLLRRNAKPGPAAMRMR